jgi:hypothetical protein
VAHLVGILYIRLVIIAGIYITHKTQKQKVIRAERERTKDRELGSGKKKLKKLIINRKKTHEALKSTQAHSFNPRKWHHWVNLQRHCP